MSVEIFSEFPSLEYWAIWAASGGLNVSKDGYAVPLMMTLLFPDNSTDNKEASKKYSIPEKCEDEVLKKLHTPAGVENLEDLYQCIAFSNVTREIKQLEKTAEENPFDDPNIYNLTDFITDLDEKYEVKESENNTELAVKLSQNIGSTLNQGCFDISCGRIKNEEEEGKLKDEKTDSSCSPEKLWLDQKHTVLNFDNVLDCRKAMCDRVKLLVKADPDIGGAGVFISYLMQVILALGVALYIFVKALTGTHRRRVGSPNGSRSNSPQRTIDAHPVFVRQLNAFQRLQAWFVASLVVAGSIRNFRHHVSNVDRYLFVAITLNALALLSFSLLTVHHVTGKSPWTTVAISAISYIICAVFYCVALSKRDNRIAKLYNNLWTCGEEGLEGVKMAPIKTFLNTVNSIPKAVYGIVLVFTAIIMVAIILDNTKKIGGIWHRQSRIVRGIVWGVVGGCYIMILVMQIFIMAPYFRVVDYQEWGFGQLMAISFWLPLIYDYISERFLEKEEENHHGDNRGQFHDIKSQGPEDYELRERDL